MFIPSPGAGSAGSVLANRLSADPAHRVLVLEAGRESHPWSRIPVGFARLIQNPAANWLYSSEPDDGTGQRRFGEGRATVDIAFLQRDQPERRCPVLTR